VRALFLHLDDALDGQPTLLAQGQYRRLAVHDLGPDLRLWSRPPALAALRARLDAYFPAIGPDLVFAGSGDFHHVTPLLIERAMPMAVGGPVTIIHFDNHPDWVKFGPGLHCGSWVGRAARIPGIARLITVGVCSADLRPKALKQADLSLLAEGRVEIYPYRTPDGASTLELGGYRWPTIEGLGEEAFLHFLSLRIETEAVYITIDKDVLCLEDALTNWDQGRISLAYLERLITTVMRGRRVIGADVVGDWSKPRYGPGPWAGLLKRAEALLDQPPMVAGIPLDVIRTVNETANLRLLGLLGEAA
jgi:hypothetical protein